MSYRRTDELDDYDPTAFFGSDESEQANNAAQEGKTGSDERRVDAQEDEPSAKSQEETSNGSDGSSHQCQAKNRYDHSPLSSKESSLPDVNGPDECDVAYSEHSASQASIESSLPLPPPAEMYYYDDTDVPPEDMTSSPPPPMPVLSSETASSERDTPVAPVKQLSSNKDRKILQPRSRRRTGTTGSKALVNFGADTSNLEISKPQTDTPQVTLQNLPPTGSKVVADFGVGTGDLKTLKRHTDMPQTNLPALASEAQNTREHQMEPDSGLQRSTKDAAVAPTSAEKEMPEEAPEVPGEKPKLPGLFDLSFWKGASFNPVPAPEPVKSPKKQRFAVLPVETGRITGEKATEATGSPKKLRPMAATAETSGAAVEKAAEEGKGAAAGAPEERLPDDKTASASDEHDRDMSVEFEAMKEQFRIDLAELIARFQDWWAKVQALGEKIDLLVTENEEKWKALQTK